MPAPPRWLIAVPDAIRQLEALDRDLLTRRDVERLFGVSRARAAQLMRTFGAELVGASRVLRRTELLRQLRKYRQRAAFRGEEERRTRPGRHRAPPGAAHRDPGRGAPSRRSRRACPACPRAYRSNPAGSRCASAARKDAVGRLFALAQALTHDYEQFEALVDGEDAGRGGGAVRA